MTHLPALRGTALSRPAFAGRIAVAVKPFAKRGSDIGGHVRFECRDSPLQTFFQRPIEMKTGYPRLHQHTRAPSFFAHDVAFPIK